MNKAEFINFMVEHGHSKHHGGKMLTKVEADKALAWVLESFMEALKQQQGVNITGYCALSVLHRKARKGRNPKTGAVMTIAAYNQPVLKFGSKMKEACN